MVPSEQVEELEPLIASALLEVSTESSQLSARSESAALQATVMTMASNKRPSFASDMLRAFAFARPRAGETGIAEFTLSGIFAVSPQIKALGGIDGRSVWR